jgi:hypothetical protein
MHEASTLPPDKKTRLFGWYHRYTNFETYFIIYKIDRYED